MDVSTIILGLVSFLQILFFFILKRFLDTQDKMNDKIDKNEDDGRKERESMKHEYNQVLDKHYVTTGQLNTLEERLIGKIQALSTAIEHLTHTINQKM